MPALLPDGDDSILHVELTRRQKAVLRAFRYYHFRNKIHYSQARPTQIRLPRETTRLDCSGLVACCMDFAGVMPKVDWRYTNTWVQINWGTAVATVKGARPGDVVFYGTSPRNPTHEALFLASLSELAALVKVPAEVQGAMRAGGQYVLSMGHYPMGIYPVDYRGDRVQIRDLIGKDARPPV